MNSALNFLKLAVIAYKNNQFDQSGAMFAQAAESPDLEEVLGSLGTTGLETEVADEEDTNTSTSANNPVRRRAKLGRISSAIAASMEAVASDAVDAEIVDDFEEDAAGLEPDPDFPGQPLIPTSFSADNSTGAPVKSAVGFKGR